MKILLVLILNLILNMLYGFLIGMLIFDFSLELLGTAFACGGLVINTLIQTHGILSKGEIK